MEGQIIISISREYGSGGHEIAEVVAKEMGLKLYDRNLLDAIAQEKNISAEELHKFDEKPRNVFMTRSVNGHSNAMEDVVMDMQSEYLQTKAAAGESFVVVGRCAETALKDYDCLVKVFVMGEKEHKLARIEKKYGLSGAEAEKKISRHDAKRKAYHNHYSASKWGDSRGYDLCVNSSRTTVAKAAKLIEQYVESIDE